MSFTSSVERECPKGCESFEVEIWSYIRADKDEWLKEKVLAGDLNWATCPHCGNLFFCDEIVIYHDPPEELLAFIYPESCRKDRMRWQKKMQDDALRWNESRPESGKWNYPPKLFFGLKELQEFLRGEEEMKIEAEIAEHLARKLRLSIYRVQPWFARDHRIPLQIPCAPAPREDLKESMRLGLTALLAENRSLRIYKKYLDQLRDTRGTWSRPPSV